MATGLSHTQYGDHYPLVDPSDDIKGIIADMTVSYDDPQWEYQLPITIQELDIANAHIILNARENVILNTHTDNVVDSSVTPWGFIDDEARYRIYTWTTNSVQVKLVIDNSNYTDEIITPESAQLDLRAVWFAPKHVRTINGHTGNVVIQAGYNLDLSATPFEVNNRKGSYIHLNAVGGAGKGKLPATCDEVTSAGIKAINGVKPDEHGNIFLVGEGGPQISVSNGTITIGNTNTPCCSCEDMASFLDYFNAVAKEYQIIGGKLKYLYNIHKDHVDYWNNEMTVNPSEPPVTLQLVNAGFPYFDLFLNIQNIADSNIESIQVDGKFHLLDVKLISLTESNTEENPDHTYSVKVNGKLFVGSAIKISTFLESRRVVNHTVYNKEVNNEAMMLMLNVKQGAAGLYHAKFKVDPEETNQTEYYSGNIPYLRKTKKYNETHIEFEITKIRVVYCNGTTIEQDYNHGLPVVYNEDKVIISYPPVHPYLEGVKYRSLDLKKNEKIEDTMDDTTKVEDIVEQIWKIKKSSYPSCPNTEE